MSVKKKEPVVCCQVSIPDYVGIVKQMLLDLVVEYVDDGNNPEDALDNTYGEGDIELLVKILDEFGFKVEVSTTVDLVLTPNK